MLYLASNTSVAVLDGDFVPLAEGALGVVFLPVFGWAESCIPREGPHPCFESSSREQSCRAVVEANPANVSARLSLCQALVLLDRHEEALDVVKGGLRACSERADCRNLSAAEAFVSVVSLCAQWNAPTPTPWYRLFGGH